MLVSLGLELLREAGSPCISVSHSQLLGFLENVGNESLGGLASPLGLGRQLYS